MALGISNASDKGTFVLAATTEEGVVIVADSKITDTSDGSQREQEKVIPFGATGSCAVSGYLGRRILGLDLLEGIALAATKIVQPNAIQHAPEIIQTIHNTWTSHVSRLGQLPNGRVPGQEALRLYLSDLVGGTPTFRVFIVVVSADGSLFVPIYHPEDSFGSLLRTSGAIDTRVLYDWSSEPPVLRFQPADVLLVRNRFRSRLSQESQVRGILAEWARRVASANGPDLFNAKCTQSEVLAVASVLFPLFAAIAPGVGPPFRCSKLTKTDRTFSVL